MNYKLKKFIINSIASSDLLDFKQRFKLYRQLGLDIKSRAIINPKCYFSHYKLQNVTIGEDSYINSHCYFNNEKSIQIGQNTFLGCHVKILNDTHHIGSSKKRVGEYCVKSSVIIGDGCWIGSGVIILPGVTIGNGVVIGAGAVVTKDCYDNGLYVGVPAKRIKDYES